MPIRRYNCLASLTSSRRWCYLTSTIKSSSSLPTSTATASSSTSRRATSNTSSNSATRLVAARKQSKMTRRRNWPNLQATWSTEYTTSSNRRSLLTPNGLSSWTRSRRSSGGRGKGRDKKTSKRFSTQAGLSPSTLPSRSRAQNGTSSRRSTLADRLAIWTRALQRGWR